MQINSITSKYKLWSDVINYANNCDREAGPILAEKMKKNNFFDRERVFVLTENDSIGGYCTFTKEDGISNCDYSPFVGFMFVDEKYRGNRYSEKMINEVEEYAKTLNFEKIYIVSDHKGLYEKYGFEKFDEVVDDCGRKESVFVRKFDHYNISTFNQ